MTTFASLAIVMPAFNETEGIKDFIEELDLSIGERIHLFIVVNDCSTDNTSDSVLSLRASGIPVQVVDNDQNLGHGQSTLRALTLGVQSGHDLVMSIDGDGQFLGRDIARILEVAEIVDGWEVIEGNRLHRKDPTYRKFVSWATRQMVWSRSGVRPQDANSPLRLYRRDVLIRLMTAVPPQSEIPNLWVSALSRSWKLNIVEMAVQSVPRRASVAIGSTWAGRGMFLPSRRFLRFCMRAMSEWLYPKRSSEHAR